MPVPNPALITKPFGYAASGPYITTPIPDTTGTTGRASFEKGFPPETMTEVVAGGVPPFGQDVNGILYMATGALAALLAGQLQPFDAGQATTIGGYALGAVLKNASGTGLWMSLIAANSNNPDAGSGHASWYPIVIGGVAAVNSTGGSVTLNNNQSNVATIVVTGALVGNLTITVASPADSYGVSREWDVVNNTTGGFSVSVRTPANAGVTIPRTGASASVRVRSYGGFMGYCGTAVAYVPTNAGGTLVDGMAVHLSGGLTINSGDIRQDGTYTLVNVTGSPVTITKGTATLYNAGDGSTIGSSVALGAWGIATIRGIGNGVGTIIGSIS